MVASGKYWLLSRPTSWKFYSSIDIINHLGVTCDSGNAFTSHITKACCACYYQLKDPRCIHKFFSVETAALLANSMISSQLDYCNFLLYGISTYNVGKLQKIQNTLCRIVFRLDRTRHVHCLSSKTTLAPYYIPHLV